MPETQDDAELMTAPAAGLHDLVVRADARGVILYVSETCRGLGYEPHELVGRSGAEFVHKADLPQFAANTSRLIGAGTVDEGVNREFRYRRKDGTWAWLQGHPTILPARDGRLGDILNVFCDVTERRTMREALREQVRQARG
ncbi:MAG TPA: PAS domain-containing protein [Phenylobacterium sp.]|nr:PAS domain-containing protein [Phenylobacterium sp.]